MGEFYIGDYKDYEEQPTTQMSGDPKSVTRWRGYSFEVTKTMTVTSLIGGMRLHESGKVGHVGIYEADPDTAHNDDASIKPTKLLVARSMSSAGYKQVLSISPVTLKPGQLYLIAQGAGQAYSDGFCMGSVEWFADTVNAQIASDHSFVMFDPLEHVQWFKAWIWDELGYGYDPESIIGRLPGTKEDAAWADAARARPPIGFAYSGFNIWVKKSGEWIQVTEIWTKKGGVWQPVSSVDVNKDGWKPI